MLTKGFVDHKGRVSGSIQKEYLMVNTFKSLSVYICGRADQSDWNAGISEISARSYIFFLKSSRKIKNVPKINVPKNVPKNVPWW